MNLDADAQAAVLDALSQGAVEPEPDVEGVESTLEPADDPGEEQIVEPAEGNKGGPPKSIPYGRFREVVHERNELKGHIAAYDQKLQQMQYQMQQMQAQMQPQPQAEESFYGEDPYADYGEQQQAEDPRIAQLQQQVQQLTSHHSQQRLHQEMQAAHQAYPQIPEQLLLQSVAYTGQDPMEIAKAWAAAMPAQAAAPPAPAPPKAATPPRPRSAGGGRQTRQQQLAPQKPRSVSDVSKALFEHLQGGGSLDG